MYVKTISLLYVLSEHVFIQTLQNSSEARIFIWFHTLWTKFQYMQVEYKWAKVYLLEVLILDSGL